MGRHRARLHRPRQASRRRRGRGRHELPQHPRRDPLVAETSAVIAPHAAFYRPQRDEAWGGRACGPATPPGCPTPTRPVRRSDGCTTPGCPASAWVVLTHNSLSGPQHPDLAVRNCLGERYPWALCPSRPEVREYAATLTAESVRGLDVSTVVLEACGQLGVVHQCQHEKTDGAWSPAAGAAAVDVLLRGCADAVAGDPATTWCARLREAGDRLLAEADADASDRRCPTSCWPTCSPGGTPPPTRCATWCWPRSTRGPDRSPCTPPLDPWATGALPGLTPAAGDRRATPWCCPLAPGDASVATAARPRDALPGDVAVGSYVTAVAAQPRPDPADTSRPGRRRRRPSCTSTTWASPARPAGRTCGRPHTAARRSPTSPRHDRSDHRS